MKARRGGSVVVLAAVAVLLVTAAARADEVVDQALRIIRLHDMMHPDPASLAQDSPAALLASLRRIDAAAQWWPADVASANQQWTGEDIVGIGASVISDGTRILFVPLPGGPLARAGVVQPVRLLTLAGQATDPLGLDRVQQTLGDPARDPIEVTVQDLTGGPVSHLVLRRGAYEALAAERIETGEGPILRIHRFVKGLTLRQFRQLLEPEVSSGQPIVVDLRYSVGGDLFEALDTASLFLPAGLKLVTLEEPNGRRTVLKSVNGAIATNTPVTILIGSATISASEAFAAALHDRGKARLIGTPTYGKCLAQSAFNLVDGSILVVSTGRILSPLDWYCNGQGLEPDIRVDPAEADNTDALMARVSR